MENARNGHIHTDTQRHAPTLTSRGKSLHSHSKASKCVRHGHEIVHSRTFTHTHAHTLMCIRRHMHHHPQTNTRMLSGPRRPETGCATDNGKKRTHHSRDAYVAQQRRGECWRQRRVRARRGPGAHALQVRFGVGVLHGGGDKSTSDVCDMSTVPSGPTHAWQSRRRKRGSGKEGVGHT
jgi:hypothetical protein